MSGRIFISYRRGVDSNSAGRLHYALADRLGDDRVFMDVEAIPPGADFVDYIGDQIATSDIFLAVIGPGWLAHAERLFRDGDFVRLEVVQALTSPNIRVIPILMSDAEMPSADDLPEDMHPLLRRSGVVLRHIGFDETIGALLKDLGAPFDVPDADERDILTLPEPIKSASSPSASRRGLMAGGVALTALAVGGAWIGGVFEPKVEPPKPPPDPRNGDPVTDPVTASGARGYAVVLLNAGDRRIAVIKRQRELTGIGLRDAKELVVNAPELMVTGLELSRAEQIRKAFHGDGAHARVVDLREAGTRVFALRVAEEGTQTPAGRTALASKVARIMEMKPRLIEQALSTGVVTIWAGTDRGEGRALQKKLEAVPQLRVEIRMLTPRTLPLK